MTRRLLKLVTAFIVFWIPVIIFSKIAGEVLENKPFKYDDPILLWIHTFHSPFLDGFFIFISTIAGPLYLTLIAIVIFLYLLYKKQKLNALLVLFGVGGAAAANVVLKVLFHRARPSLWDRLVVENSYSFPSGHSMISMALVVCLVIMLWNTRWRCVSLIAGSLVVILIGSSRLYLGVHYPTDVLAGWSIGLVWVLIVTRVIRRFSLHLKG